MTVQSVESLSNIAAYLLLSSMKSAYITPILKKADLDSSDPKSYRLILNLSVLSKLLERLVSKQLVTYLLKNDLFPISSQFIDLITRRRLTFSRSCRISYFVLALRQGGITVTFRLVSCLRHRWSRHAVAKTTDVLRSGRERYRLVQHLSYWTYTVRPTATSRSISLAVLSGVPLGSVLRPILFLLYVADLLQLVKRHGLHPQCYADDTRCMGYSTRRMLTHCKRVCLSALMKFSPGWCPTGCSTADSLNIENQKTAS